MADVQSYVLRCECDIGTGNASPVTRIFAVVCLREDRRLALLAPNLVTDPPRVESVMFVPLVEVPVDGRLRLVQGLVVAVVDDRAGHAGEDGLDHVEELGARG